VLYTTYFANSSTLALDITPVSICGQAPAGYKGLKYKKLAPKWEFFKQWKQTGDNHYYVRCFAEQVLDKLNADEVYQELVGLAKNTDIALVCYEKPDDFCHRHLVANWFRENGFKIRKW